MRNMSYCRFRNTIPDLLDCENSMDDDEFLSEEESSARKRLIKICVRIADDYGDEVENDV